MESMKKKCLSYSFHKLDCIRGGSRILSRGGGVDFRILSENFIDVFCRSTILIFQALPKHCFVHILAKLSAPQAKI